MSSVKLAAPAALVALALSGCGGNKSEKAAVAPAPTIAATVVAVANENVPEGLEATGTVRARVTTAVAARVMAYVREMRVQMGDSVQAGQTLVVLDARDTETGVRQAEFARTEARSALPEVQNAIAAAQAQFDLAQATYNRMKDLFDKKSITNQEFDEAAAKLKMARANLDMAQARREQVQAKIRQADEAVAQAGVMKSYSEITAPFAGVVTEKRAEPGTLAAPGVPLLTIEQAAAFRAEIPVEEAQLSRIRAGSKVQVDIEALNRTLDLAVTEIVPSVDAASRTITARVNLPGGLPLKSGLFVRARFPFGQRQALLVPAAAVQEQGQLKRVFVSESGQARARFVTIGARFGDKAEVLSGVSAGETVVHPLPAGLVDGAKLEVRP